MPDDEPPDPNTPNGHDNPGARWDPTAILRSRLETARHQQDESLAALRASMDDEQILAGLGIDLTAIDNANGHPENEAADDTADADPDGEGTGQ